MYRLCRQTSSGTYIFICSQSGKGFRSCQVPIYFPQSFLLHWNSLLPTWNWRLRLFCSMIFQIIGYCSRHQFGQTVLLSKSLFHGSPTFCCSLGGCCCCCRCCCHSASFLRSIRDWTGCWTQSCWDGPSLLSLPGFCLCTSFRICYSSGCAPWFWNVVYLYAGGVETWRNEGVGQLQRVVKRGEMWRNLSETETMATCWATPAARSIPVLAQDCASSYFSWRHFDLPAHQ